MGAQITLRVPDDLAKRLMKQARRLGKRRSQVVRDALELYLEGGLTPASAGRAYERVRDLIGSYRSGVPDLGLRHREHLMARLRRGR